MSTGPLCGSPIVSVCFLTIVIVKEYFIIKAFLQLVAEHVSNRRERDPVCRIE